MERTNEEQSVTERRTSGGDSGGENREGTPELDDKSFGEESRAIMSEEKQKLELESGQESLGSDGVDGGDDTEAGDDFHEAEMDLGISEEQLDQWRRELGPQEPDVEK